MLAQHTKLDGGTDTGRAGRNRLLGALRGVQDRGMGEREQAGRSGGMRAEQVRRARALGAAAYGCAPKGHKEGRRLGGGILPLYTAVREIVWAVSSA